MTHVVSLILLPMPMDAPPPMLIHHKVAWRYMASASAKRPADMAREVNDRLHEAVTSGNLNKLEGRGQILYADVLPADARRILYEVGQSGETVLLIHNWPKDEWIPWEIMHDGDEFLGVKFQIARLPVLASPIIAAVRDLGNGHVRQVHSIRSVLGKNVLDGPPAGLDAVWQSTFSGLAPQPGIELSSLPSILGAGADWPTEGEADDVQHDVVHLTCHGNVEYNGKRVWSLTLDEPSPSKHYLDRDWVNHLDLGARKPLVFSNACSSAGAGVVTEVIPTFGQEFVERGAHNFVGSFAAVTKSLALDFARQFYQRLLDNAQDLTIGEALLAAKRHYHHNPGQQDASYLFYCLYGPHDTRYRLPA
jgi:hypothetical protein